MYEHHVRLETETATSTTPPKHSVVRPEVDRAAEERAAAEHGGDVPEALGREHVRGGRDLELRRHRRAVERPQVELVPARRRVEEDAPVRDQLGVVVVLHEVGDARARVLDLLVAVAERREHDRAVRLERVLAVRPDEDAGDAGWRRAYIRL
jgi:hypothetical protein